MYRRYTIHKDGDLLVEELDPSGKPIDPEPVPAEERLPVEVVLMAADTLDARAQLLEILEMAYEMEAETPGGGSDPNGPTGGMKLNVLR